MAKSHRLPSHTSIFVYSLLELIFTDLWGPPHLTSYVGYKYYVSSLVFFLGTLGYFPSNLRVKLSIFQAFKSMVELKLNTKIKSVQSD